MTGSGDPSGVPDVRFTENAVFGSLSGSPTAAAASISPRLPFAEAGAIIEDSAPNLISALRWEYGLTATLRGRGPISTRCSAGQRAAGTPSRCD